jgi:hypothetical protein
MEYMAALAIVAALVTVGILVAGISAMATNSKVGRHTSEEWMVFRVLAQGTAVLFFVLSQFP